MQVRAGHLVQQDQDEFVNLTKKILSEASSSQKEETNPAGDTKVDEIKLLKSEPSDCKPHVLEDETSTIAVSEIQEDIPGSHLELSSSADGYNVLELSKHPPIIYPSAESPVQATVDVSVSTQTSQCTEDETLSESVAAEALSPQSSAKLAQATVHGAVQIVDSHSFKPAQIYSREPTPLPSASVSMVSSNMVAPVEPLTAALTNPPGDTTVASVSGISLPTSLPCDPRMLAQQSILVKQSPVPFPSLPYPSTLSVPVFANPHIVDATPSLVSMPSYQHDTNTPSENLPSAPTVDSITHPSLTSTTSNNKFKVEDVADVDASSDLSATSVGAPDKEEPALAGRDVTEASSSTVASIQNNMSSNSIGGVEFFPPSQPPPPRAQSATSWLHATPGSYDVPWNVVRQRSATMQYATIPGLYPSTNMPTLPELGFFTQSTPAITVVPSIGSSVPADGTSAPAMQHASFDELANVERKEPPHQAEFGVLADLPVAQVSMFTEAFGKFLHAMNSLVRDPAMTPILNSLDQQYGAPSDMPCHDSPPAAYPRPEVAVTCSSTTVSTLILPWLSKLMQSQGYILGHAMPMYIQCVYLCMYFQVCHSINTVDFSR